MLDMRWVEVQWRGLELYRKQGRLEGFSTFPNRPSHTYTVRYWARKGPFSVHDKPEKRMFQFRVEFKSIAVPEYHLVNHRQWKGIHPNLFSTGKLCHHYPWDSRDARAFAGLIQSLMKWVDEPNYGSPTSCYRGRQ